MIKKIFEQSRRQQANKLNTTATKKKKTTHSMPMAKKQTEKTTKKKLLSIECEKLLTGFSVRNSDDARRSGTITTHNKNNLVELMA